MYYFCPTFYELTHGVMVAQQILVLSVKVRILVGQQTSGNPRGFFIFVYDPVNFYGCYHSFGNWLRQEPEGFVVDKKLGDNTTPGFNP
jgi:hypothetical protein